ncbi:MAG: stage II sporulation protein M [Paracoccaceae bacterium]
MTDLSPDPDPDPDRERETETAEALRLRSARFRAEREADWQRLEALVTRVERRGPPALSFEEARDLASLYRRTLAATSVARAISLDRALLAYLETLSARAYFAVYAPQESLSGLVGRFFGRGAPAATRRSAGALGWAALTLAAGSAIGAALFFDDPAWYDLVARAPGDPRGPEATREALRAVIYDGEDETVGDLGAFASFLFSNNARVAIFAFALGAFALLPAMLLVLYNGVTFGAFVALHVDRGLGPDIAGWLSIHGVTELGAIVVATAGGYRLGLAWLFPGARTRRAALRRVAGDATKLALVAILMLLAAAVLEGFGRQMVQSTEWRLAIGWGVGLGWVLWLARTGRGGRRGA